MVEVVVQCEDQDIAAIPDATRSHIELSMCKGMLPQVKKASDLATCSL